MSKLPAYKIVYNKLKSDIDNDVYPIGSFLPTESELEKIFSVSRTTIRHAIDLLVKDRKIQVRQGAGTQVVKITESELPFFSKFHNVIDIRTEIPNAVAVFGSIVFRLQVPLLLLCRLKKTNRFSDCSESFVRTNNR